MKWVENHSCFTGLPCAVRNCLDPGQSAVVVDFEPLHDSPFWIPHRCANSRHLQGSISPVSHLEVEVDRLAQTRPLDQRLCGIKSQLNIGSQTGCGVGEAEREKDRRKFHGEHKLETAA